MATYELADAFVDIDTDEDRLTKAVFGCFELLSAQTINEVFRHTDIDAVFEDEPEFTFHETVDRREPDVVLTDETNLTILVESKLRAPTNIAQLEEEYDDLIDHYRSETRLLLHVTDQPRRPQRLDRVDVPEKDLLWTNWRTLAAAVRQVDPEETNQTDRRVLGMLTQILDANGFRPFDGFTLMDDSPKLSDQLEQAYDARNTYYEEVNAFRKDAESRLVDDIGFWKFFRRGVSGGMGGGLNRFPTSEYERMPEHLWFSYTPNGDAPRHRGSKYKRNYLTLDFNSRTGTLRVGYIVTTNGEMFSDFRESLNEHRDTVLEVLSENDLEAYTTSYSLSTRLGPSDDIEAFLKEIDDPGYDESEWGKRFMIARSWSADSLPTRTEAEDTFRPTEAPTAVAEALNEIHDLTYSEYRDVFYPGQN